MNRFRRRLWLALTDNVAATSPSAEDPRLEGRTYAIPFDRVWRAALALADGGLPRWRLLAADDQDGIIHAESTTRVLRMVDDVTIRIRLDADAQTRVDARSVSRTGRADLGANARRLGKFFRELDDALMTGKAQPVALPERAR